MLPKTVKTTMDWDYQAQLKVVEISGRYIASQYPSLPESLKDLISSNVNNFNALMIRLAEQRAKAAGSSMVLPEHVGG